MAVEEVGIVFTAKDLTAKGFKTLGAGLTRTLGLAKSVTGQIFSLKGAFLGLGAGAVGAQFIATANQTEALKIRLNALTGSVGEGNRLFEEMTEYASGVAFSYEDVMTSATSLSGVLKGNVDEVTKWMPLIGDLAAVSGLSITEATDQVQRMLASGARSAELFADRGVLEMLGFTAGVSVSAEETKTRLMALWEDADSRFRGTSANMSTTLTGIWSMIGDKWQGIQQTIMDGGMMNFLKAISMTIDEGMGGALTSVKEDSNAWVMALIHGAFNVMDSLAGVVSWFMQARIAVKGLELTWLVTVAYFKTGVSDLVNGMRPLLEMIESMTDLELRDDIFMDLKVGAARAGMEAQRLKFELEGMANADMPTTMIDEFKDSVLNNFTILQAESKRTSEVLADTGASTGTATTPEGGDEESPNTLEQALIDEKLLMVETGLAKEQQLYAEYYADWVKMREGVNATQRKLEVAAFGWRESIRQGDVKGTLASAATMLKSAVGNSKKMFKVSKAVSLASAIATLPSAVMKSYANGGGYPWGLVPAGLMLATGLVQIAKIKNSQMGQAHAGLTDVPNDQTYFLRAGERVLAPQQNTDLKAFLKDTKEGGAAGGAQVIENVNISMFEGSDPQTFLAMDDSEVVAAVEAKIIPALNLLNQRGVTLDAVTELSI